MDKQMSMFETEDTPLFSGTPMPGKESIYKPEEPQPKQVPIVFGNQNDQLDKPIEDAWVTNEMIKEARRDITLPRAYRVEVFNDHAIEKHAAYQPYHWGQTVKQVIDTWIKDHAAKLERKGSNYYVLLDPEYKGCNRYHIGKGMNYVIEYMAIASKWHKRASEKLDK